MGNTERAPLPGLHLFSGVDERRRSSVACIAFWSGLGVLGVGMSMLHVLYLVVLLLVLCIAARAGDLSILPSQARVSAVFTL